MVAPHAGITSELLRQNFMTAGLTPIATKKYTLVSGTVVAGSVLGRVVASISKVADAGNVGDGTIGAITAALGLQIGEYRVVCVEPHATAAAFIVEDPAGVTLGHAIVGAAFSQQLAFTITDGATDFAAGDGFTITVAQSSTSVRRCTATATDGSHRAAAIASHDASAADGPVDLLVYTAGEFAESACDIDDSLDLETVREQLQLKGIELRDVASA